MAEVSILKDTLAKLAKRFESKHKNEWDEAGVRQSLLNPFWDALGWDTSDPGQVEVEKRTLIDEKTKRADYAFLLRGRAKFLSEAKQPTKNLANDKHAIFQLKRYVFNTKGAQLGILQDFEEFRPFLVIKKPEFHLPTDGLQKNLIMKYTEYADRAEELLNVFSREATKAGSIDELLPKGAKLQRDPDTIDNDFFKEIMGYRYDIGQSIVQNNTGISETDLNLAVNHLLNRILFLRVIEERRIENYDPLETAFNKWKKEELGPLMAYLIEVFERLAPKYNGAIFDKHYVDQLIIDDKPLYDCIYNLYYPQTPYQFNEMPIEVIGNAYEQYLSSLLKIKGNDVDLVEKPEVDKTRKSGGVYYTPKYIVDYIVEQTVGKLVEGKTPAQVSKLRILDPACGSGSFLIGAFERLQKYYVDYYTANPKKNKGYLREDYEGKPKLDILVKKKILEENIYGVDIDSQAVDITEFSLYVKMMEGEENLPMFAETYLPELKENIKCGNSLISWDILDMDILPAAPVERQAELERIKPFDWRKEFPEIFANGGFDVVIGNPPWGSKDILEELDINYITAKFSRSAHNLNVFAIFVDASTKHFLRKKGLLGFLIPKNFIKTDAYRDYRLDLLCEHNFRKIIDYGKFPGVAQEAIAIILAAKEKPGTKIIREYFEDEKYLSLEKLPIARIVSDQFAVISLARMPDITPIITKMNAISFNLGNEFKVIRGMEHGRNGDLIQCPYCNKYFEKPGKKNSEKTKAICKHCKEVIDLTIEHNFHRFIHARDKHAGNYELGGLLIGDSIERYVLKEIPYSVTLGLDGINYKDLNLISEKLYFIRIAQTLRGFLDEAGLLSLNALNVVYDTGNSEYNLRYILGLLNSKLFVNYARFSITAGAKLTIRFSNKIMRSLPIRTIDFDNPEDVAKHDRMVALVEDMLALNKRLHETESPSTRKSIEAQIAHTDNKIDLLVYKLYDLIYDEVLVIDPEFEKKMSREKYDALVF